MNKTSQQGFTLVELAIVLMIIGLLIGGILRGQELMENARVTSTIQQVTAYQGAKHTFMDAYAMLPGDIATANARIPGCVTANACISGNGDGIVGILNAGNGSYANEPWQDVPAAVNTENTQFWKHLALTHLISGINPSATEPDWGASHPTAKIGGGFFMRFSNFAGNEVLPSTSSHYIVLRNGISGQWTCGGTTSTGTCVISPMRAAQIDRKADDGIATTGDILAISANWGNGCGAPGRGTNGPTGYLESQEDKACDMMFKIP